MSAAISEGVWNNSDREKDRLDWLEQLPFSLLFVSGNHENFELLAQYPVEKWNGGYIQRIRPHVIHLMRGQIFQLQGLRFFTMGGAQSHDIADGILDPEAPDFEEQYWAMRRMRALFRVNHYSWWKEEMPSKEEYEQARTTLDQAEWEVDYIITHCAPSTIVDRISNGTYRPDRLTDFLEEIRTKGQFQYWLFGHYHDNRKIENRYVLLWEQIVQIL